MVLGRDACCVNFEAHIVTKQLADKWIRFLRSYGPVTINEGMYAENIAKLASSYDIPELRFPHPLQAKVFDSIDPRD